jgi:hypothetical protein
MFFILTPSSSIGSLSAFSVRYEKCQSVKSYDDNLAEGGVSPLALHHFVIYRLCPTDSCQSCKKVVYGKYAVDVSTYLLNTIDYEQQRLKRVCKTCDASCSGNASSSSYCAACLKECDFYQNMANYGYVNAAEYTECQQINYATNDDAGNAAMYVGPRCSSSGMIVISLFSDDSCNTPVDTISVETALAAKLSYILMKPSNGTGAANSCMSCKERTNANDDDQNQARQNDKQDADDVVEMCENVYNRAAKCESKTGIQVGFIQTKRQYEQQNGGYDNQVEDEYLSCTFIDSLIWNSYTETGEIDIKSQQDVIVRRVTNNQAVSMSFLSVFVAGLLAAIYFVDRKIQSIELSNSFLFRGHTMT